MAAKDGPHVGVIQEAGLVPYTVSWEDGWHKVARACRPTVRYCHT